MYPCHGSHSPGGGPDSRPAVHEIKLAGQRKIVLRIFLGLDEHWSRWFDGMVVCHDEVGDTILRGPVADQSALHGLLQKIVLRIFLGAKVRDLGLPLLAVTRCT
jgi:hypothetical protein